MESLVLVYQTEVEDILDVDLLLVETQGLPAVIEVDELVITLLLDLFDDVVLPVHPLQLHLLVVAQLDTLHLDGHSRHVGHLVGLLGARFAELLREEVTDVLAVFAPFQTVHHLGQSQNIGNVAGSHVD